MFLYSVCTPVGRSWALLGRVSPPAEAFVYMYYKYITALGLALLGIMEIKRIPPGEGPLFQTSIYDASCMFLYPQQSSRKHVDRHFLVRNFARSELYCTKHSRYSGFRLIGIRIKGIFG